MQHDRLLCLDIETVPDRDLVPADWGDKFPKPMWHRVVAISVVEAVIERDGAGRERYRVECCRSGGEADWDERRLLQAWWRHFGDCSARVVTWNGKGFDLPVLRLRAMMHGLSAEPWFTRGDKWNGYTQRYAPDWHCDLMDQLADCGAHAKMSLQEAAMALGLPGKIGGHGAEVADMVDRGEIDKVRAYCEADCLNLFVLYVRWAFLTGKLDAAGHDASLQSLVECLSKERAERAHLGTFLDAWRGATRPAPMFVAGAAAAVGDNGAGVPSDEPDGNLDGTQRTSHETDDPDGRFPSLFECACVEVGKPACGRFPCVESSRRAGAFGILLE
jgi:predicted PolB exonuclease-like 3'-5' exonuclease